MKEIELESIFKDINPLQYKVHFARRSDNNYEPLDEYIASFDNWVEWNRYSNQDDYNREFVFSLISFYPESDTWLFGGIWRILSRDMSKKPYPYEIELVDDYSEYIGRLKIKYSYKSRRTRVKLENHFKYLMN